MTIGTMAGFPSPYFKDFTQWDPMTAGDPKLLLLDFKPYSSQLPFGPRHRSLSWQKRHTAR
jgi:hypothetical protein